MAAEFARGVPNFNIVDINPLVVAQALQEYLIRGSKLTGVGLDDIKTSLAKEIKDVSKVTLVELLEAGMKMFDALVWLSAGKPDSHPLTVDTGLTTDSIISLHEVARAVFYCYFFILTQARYPVSRTAQDAPRVPNFLRNTMGMSEDQHVYVSRVCSFEPEKFDKRWVKHIQFVGMSQEVLSRFGLGVGGYRIFTPFKSYKPKDGLSPEIRAAFDFARSVAISPASWEIHPVTRNPNVLSSRGNLNKNCANLILECFEEDDIRKMVANKMLFAMPVHDPNHTNYRTWAARNDITGEDFIFRPTQ